MSESVSYRMRALNGKAGEIIRINFAKRGIFFHDRQAWVTAKERVEQLQALLERELEKYPFSDPCSQKYLSIEQEWGRADAMLRSFCSVPAFKVYAEQTRANELQAIRKEMGVAQKLEVSTRANETVNSLHQIQKRIEDLAAGVQEELCQMEKGVLLGTVSEALTDLGYLIERNGEMMKATLSRSCIWLETNPWGELSLDCSGFSGLSCLQEVQRIENQLFCKGIMLSRNSSEFHGKPEGGVLAGKLEPLFPIFKRLGPKQTQAAPGRPKIKIGG